MYNNTVTCITGRYHVSTLTTSLIKLASEVSFKFGLDFTISEIVIEFFIKTLFRLPGK